MNKLFALILLATLAVLGAKQLAMTRLDCAAPPPPAVTAMLHVTEPVLDESRSIAQVTAMYRGGSTHGALPAYRSGYAAAVSQSNIAAAATYPNLKRRKSFFGTYCFIPAAVTVNITLGQTVYMSGESFRDRCQFDVTLEHEMKHLAVNRDVLRENTPRFEKTVREALHYFFRKHGHGPFAAAQADLVQQDLTAYMDAAINLAIHDVYEVINRAQSRVDTRAEYDRIRAQCRWR